MDIRNIEFSALNLGNGLCQGVVTLLTVTGATHCACQVAANSGQTLAALQRALLAEALRQIGRMPEYRRGLARINLAAPVAAQFAPVRPHAVQADLPLAA